MTPYETMIRMFERLDRYGKKAVYLNRYGKKAVYLNRYGKKAVYHVYRDEVDTSERYEVRSNIPKPTYCVAGFLYTPQGKRIGICQR